MARKIVLTNFNIPENQLRRIESLDRERFEVGGVDQIRPEEYSSVEVLLLERGEEWLTEEKIRKMTNLRLFQNLSAGVDHIDFEMIPERVVVCGNVGGYADQIAEHVLATILYFAKNLPLHHENLRNGVFRKEPSSLFLKGKTLGILGTGGIGQAVAKLGKAMGMRTIGINTSGKSVINFDLVRTLDSVNDLLSESNIVVIALPLTSKTEHLINHQRFGLLKEDCILVNIARGDIIEKEALYNHLKNHPKFRAVIDVWWRYPNKDQKFEQGLPFFELPNFLGSPHVSGTVPEADEISLNLAIANIERYVRNEPLRGVMDRKEYVGLRPVR